MKGILMSALIDLALPAARNYLLEVLSGEPGLCAPMRNVVASKGLVYSLVPAGTSGQRAEQFNAGGLTSAAATEESFVQRMIARGGTLIVQDSFAPSSYYDRPIPAETLVRDGVVFLWTRLGPQNSDAIRSCWRLPMSWTYFGFVFHDSSAEQKLDEQDTALQDLVDSVIELYVPAYDQESFVHWAR
jgi:hypothetical protein